MFVGTPMIRELNDSRRLHNSLRISFLGNSQAKLSGNQWLDVLRTPYIVSKLYFQWNTFEE